MTQPRAWDPSATPPSVASAGTRASIFRPGDRGPGVRDIRDRLASSGDLPAHGRHRESAPARPAPGSVAGDPEPSADGRTTAEREPYDPELYDDEVETAVRAFQQRRGLLADGVVGPQTYRALDGSRWSLGDRILLHSPGHLVSGDDVAELQERLLGLGFDSGRSDGLFGPVTEAALREFQRGVGLSPDGTCGPATLRALAQLLSRSVSGGASQTLRETEQVRRAGPSLAGRLVVLDPGHGGTDLGVEADGLVEAELTLDLARRIEGRLAATGVLAVLTRAAGSGPDEVARATMANAVGADLVVSIHCEASPTSSASGVATYFYGHDRPGAWSAVGERLADLVQRELVARTGMVDCQAHARTWDLLRRTRMPTVRVDVGYLTHAGDAERLRLSGFRDAVADAVVVAIQRLYLGEDDTTSTGVLRIADVMAQAGRAPA